MPAGTAHSAIAPASSRVPTCCSSKRFPVNQTAATTPRAIISPQARRWNRPRWMAPDDGLGIDASSPSTATTLPVAPGPLGDGSGELDGALADAVAVVVERGHVVAAVEPEPLDGAHDQTGDAVRGAGVDHVVVGRGDEQERARHL